MKRVGRVVSAIYDLLIFGVSLAYAVTIINYGYAIPALSGQTWLMENSVFMFLILGSTIVVAGCCEIWDS